MVTRANARVSEIVGSPVKIKHVSLKEAAETGRDKKYKDKTFVEKAALWNETAEAVAKTVNNNAKLNRKMARKIRAAAGVVQLAAALASETSQSIDAQFIDAQLFENMEIQD